jgi:hypothetical protein
MQDLSKKIPCTGYFLVKIYNYLDKKYRFIKGFVFVCKNKYITTPYDAIYPLPSSFSNMKTIPARLSTSNLQ